MIQPVKVPRNNLKRKTSPTICIDPSPSYTFIISKVLPRPSKIPVPLPQGSKNNFQTSSDTHQVQPTEVKTPKPGQDHHHSLALKSPYFKRKNEKKNDVRRE
jgi:hypothetical protein